MPQCFTFGIYICPSEECDVEEFIHIYCIYWYLSGKKCVKHEKKVTMLVLNLELSQWIMLIGLFIAMSKDSVVFKERREY